MGIHRSDSRAMQTLGRDEVEHFRMFRRLRHRKRVEQIQGLLAVREIAAGKLLDDEGMNENGTFIQ